MRVCIVTPYDLSHDGGVNRHALGLARALGGLGVEARVLGPASGAVPEGCDGLRGVLPVPANGSVARIGLLVSERATCEYLDAHDFDAIHVHEPIVPGPGRHALRHARVPVVATFHANAEHEPRMQSLLRRVASGGLSRIDFGIAVSRQAKRFARPIFRGRIAVIPNGVDRSRFRGDTDAAPRPAHRPPRVLFVGRFGEPRKGVAVLLDALERLHARGQAVEATVVGDGPLDRHAGRAERLGARFLGRVSDDALARCYRESDVFCAPSLGGESFGMVLAEAMAAGCPVVASDIPGYAEAARGAALLVRAGDPDALAAALWRAGNDADLRARLWARGRARAEALCWSRVAGRVLHIYRVAGAAGPAVTLPALAPVAARAARG